MDRTLSQQMLTYMRSGTVPVASPLEVQTEGLQALARYLELEGWSLATGVPVQGMHVPIRVEREGGGPPVFVGLRPALIDRAAAAVSHPLSELAERAGARCVLLNDYVVSRDLPTAYQRFRSALGV